MHDTLRDPATSLIRDGVRVDRDGSVRAVEGNTYTYCQGVHLGACVALAEVDDTAERQRWADRAAELLDAVATYVVGSDGVIPGYDDGGDGGCSTASSLATWPMPRCAGPSSHPSRPGSSSRARQRPGGAGRNWQTVRCSPRTGDARPVSRPRPG